MLLLQVDIFLQQLKLILRLEEELLTDIFSQVGFKALGCKPPFNNQPLLPIKWTASTQLRKQESHNMIWLSMQPEYKKNMPYT